MLINILAYEYHGDLVAMFLANSSSLMCHATRHRHAGVLLVRRRRSTGEAYAVVDGGGLRHLVWAVAFRHYGEMKKREAGWSAVARELGAE